MQALSGIQLSLIFDSLDRFDDGDNLTCCVDSEKLSASAYDRKLR